MGSMFVNCLNLQILDFKNFDTINTKRSEIKTPSFIGYEKYDNVLNYKQIKIN